MLYFISCSVIWGLTWISIKYQFQALDFSVAVFYRFILASSLLFFFALYKKLPMKYNKSQHINFAAQGFFMFCLNYLLTYYATQLAPSALLAVTFTALIYFNMFGSKIFFGMPLEKKVIFGAFMSFLGMALIAHNEIANMHETPTSFYGVLIGLGATLTTSAGNLLSLENRKTKIPITSNNAWGMLYGSFFTFLFCVGTGKSFAFNHFDLSFVYSFFYLTIFGTIISFWAYLKLIEKYGPSRAAFTTVLSPIVAIMTSFFFEDLSPSFFLIAGASLCLIGNVVALIKLPNFLIVKTI